MNVTNQKGSVLIMTIGILGILSALAATLVSRLRTDAQAVNYYSDTARLELLARAGAELAKAALMEADAAGYHGTDQEWYTGFDATGNSSDDEDVCSIFPGDDARWIELYRTPIAAGSPIEMVGRVAIKIVDQSALVYANNDINLTRNLYNQFTNATDANNLEGPAGDYYPYLIPEVLKLEAGKDFGIDYFATFGVQHSSANSEAALNINTHYGYFSTHPDHDTGDSIGLGILESATLDYTYLMNVNLPYTSYKTQADLEAKIGAVHYPVFAAEFGDVIVKSRFFEVWGMAELTIGSEDPRTRRFRIMLDASVSPPRTLGYRMVPGWD